MRRIHQNLLHQGNKVPRKTHQSLLHQGKIVLRKINQSLLHQGKRVLRRIYQRLLLKKVVLRTRLIEVVKQIVIPTKTDLNAKKGACNEARSSEEEHVGMRDIVRKGYFEHSNEESKKKILMKRKTLEYVSVGEKSN